MKPYLDHALHSWEQIDITHCAYIRYNSSTNVEVKLLLYQYNFVCTFYAFKIMQLFYKLSLLPCSFYYVYFLRKSFYTKF